MKVSKFGALLVVVFILFSLFARLLLPFADEPDWTIRAYNVLYKDHYIWSPYSIFSEWYNELFIDYRACRIQSGVTSFWAFIPYNCTEDVAQILTRWLLTVFILLPLFLIFVFKVSFVSLMHFLGVKLTFSEWSRRIDSIAVSIILPGMMYYLGVLAEEQLFLVVTLYVFLFWGFWFPVFFLLIVLVSIDLGNSIVFSFFVLTMFCILNFLSLSRVKMFALFIVLVLFSFFVGYNFLSFLSQISFLGDGFSSKSDAMFEALDASDLVNKYPIFLRPVITFMSFVFMTPSGVKVPFLYVVMGWTFLVMSFKVLKRGNKVLDCYWFIPIFSVIFFVFLFPTYANAKYYMFVMPFFAYVALEFYSRKNVFFFCFSFSCVVFFYLLLYRF